MKFLIVLLFIFPTCYSGENFWVTCDIPIIAENIKEEICLLELNEKNRKDYILSQISSYDFSKSNSDDKTIPSFPYEHKQLENHIVTDSGCEQWQSIFINSNFSLIFFPEDSFLRPTERFPIDYQYFIFNHRNKEIFVVPEFLPYWKFVASDPYHIWLTGHSYGRSGTVKISRENPMKFSMKHFLISIENTQGAVYFQKIQNLGDRLLACVWILLPANDPKDQLKGLAYSKDHGITWTLIGYFNRAYVYKFQDFVFLEDGQGWLLYHAFDGHYVQKIANWNQSESKIKINRYFSGIFLKGNDIYLGIYEKTHIPFLKWPQNADLKQIFQIAHKGTLSLKDGKWNESMKPE